MDKYRTSLIMIVRDEENNLPRCLQSVRGAVDELIVVDTGSRDRTKKLAHTFGARVFDYRWQDDFAAARNFARMQATGQWILRLDADEALAPEGRQALTKLTEPWAEQGILRAYFGHYVHFTDTTYSPGNAQLDYGQIALFPNHAHFRFRQANYDYLEYTGPPGQAMVQPAPDLVIYDFGTADLERRERRRVQNILINRQQLERDPDNDYLRFHLCRELHLLGEHQVTLREAYELLSRHLTSPRLHPHHVAMTAYYGAFAALRLLLLLDATQLAVTGLEVYPHHYGLWTVLAGVYLADRAGVTTARLRQLMPILKHEDPGSCLARAAPSEWGGIFLVGTIHAIRKEYDQALPFFLQTYRFFPGSSMHLTCALDCVVRTGLWATAQEMLSEALVHFPHLENRIQQLTQWAFACTHGPGPPPEAIRPLLAGIAQWREEWPPS